MLRIKKDVDLKELEKFGFKLNNRGQYEHKNTQICKNRKIQGNGMNPNWSKTHMVEELYDLITAGMVEKVEK